MRKYVSPRIEVMQINLAYAVLQSVSPSPVPVPPQPAPGRKPF